MSDLTTNYMGIPLKNPIIAGASKLTSNLETIKKMEESGAGAVVTASLFEEQVQLERFKMDDEREKTSYRHPEMITVFPELEHAGPKEHLYWVQKTKESLSIPVIGSLNAVHKETWIEYAKRLEETGIDALELNFYASPKQFDRDAVSIEEEQIAILKQIQTEVKIPLSVKLSSFYTNPLHFISRLDQEGVKGFVLFNQLFQPDIDINREKNVFLLHLSRRADNRLPLRYAGLLSGNIRADICSNTGILAGEDIVKMILAGATCVQVVSTLYKNGVEQIGKMLNDLKAWMERKGYGSLDAFRGKMSKQYSKDPWVYTRAQYVKLLMNPKDLLENDPAP
ncbi:dihydroorotate dehydrogenase-like protein [bacterium]|nr:dihydroorotate dehydrogenase-like protein [bacterium]